MSTQRVKLLCKIANTEIHIAVAVREVDPAGQFCGHLGKTPWHKAPAPSRALQKVTPTHDPRIGPQNRWAREPNKVLPVAD